MRLASSASASSSSSSASSSPVSQEAKLPTSPSPSKPARRGMNKELAQFKARYPLQRGLACLSCRKRKMKCDAGKPSCGQCVKGNRASDCDYDDGKSKSRTQILQEKISLLEGRIRELEAPPDFANRTSVPSLPRYESVSEPPPSMLYDHIVPGMFGNGASFNLGAMSTSDSPSPASSPWIANHYDLQAHTPENYSWDIDPLTMTPEDVLKSSGRWWDAPQPPAHIRQLLLDIFMPHRHQCGFEIDASRFRASLASPDPPHSALLNAMYALACHFSLSPLLSPHESRFVARALHGISDALETSESLIDVLQASCLLAVLFFTKGRLLEGYYHAGAAARLAVGLGLHQITAHEWTSPGHSPSSSPSHSHRMGGSSILPPPADSVEFGERVLAFWQVFNLDRCWSVVTGLPVALLDDSHPRMRIETVWPRSLKDYEIGVSDTDYSSLHYLYSQVTTLSFSTHDSTNALRAKATTLFERAARLSSSFGTTAQTAEKFWIDFQTVDDAITRLSVSLPPPRTEGEPGSPGRMDHSLFVVHVLLHAATIQLHSPFALKDAASQQKSTDIAALATSMIHQLEDVDYQFLDPIMGTCWTSIAEALVRELIVLRAAAAIEQVDILNRQLDMVVAAMNHLGTTVPLAAYQASKVEQSRGVAI